MKTTLWRRYTTKITQMFFLGALVAVALGLNYLAAWTGPTATAPNGNVDAPVNTGTTAQVKDGNVSVGRSTNATTTLGFSAIGRAYTTGWLTVGSNAAPTQILDLRGPVGKGIRFADGTVQASAATPFDPADPLALGSTLSVQSDTTLRGQLGFTTGTVASTTYAVDLNALPVAAANAVRFADGTVQATAGRPANVKVMNVLSFDDFMHIQDRKTAGVAGKWILQTDGWVARDYTAVLTNTITGAGLTANQITLPAGTYYMSGWGSAWGANAHKILLRNVTTNTTLLIGESAFSESGGDGNDMSNAILTGRFTLAAPSDLEVWHRCATDCHLGTPSTGFTTENYSDIQIWKLD
jgi:hypothetical protein